MGARRSLLLLLVVVLLIGAGWALWPRAARRSSGAGAPPAVPPVVFLGDSITSGHRLSADMAFPHRLGRVLGVPVINAGISGDTTEGGVTRLERDVLAHHPRLVVVELGVNDAFGGWLAMIARNRAVDFHRTRRKTDELPEEFAAPRGGDGDASEAERVLCLIRTLPEAYRETLVLRLVEGMTGPEIAAQVGLTPESVRVNLHRGMSMLRERLGIVGAEP